MSLVGIILTFMFILFSPVFMFTESQKQSKFQACDIKPIVRSCAGLRLYDMIETPQMRKNINDKFGYIVANIKHHTKNLKTKISYCIRAYTGNSISLCSQSTIHVPYITLIGWIY